MKKRLQLLLLSSTSYVFNGAAHRARDVEDGGGLYGLRRCLLEHTSGGREYLLSSVCMSDCESASVSNQVSDGVHFHHFHSSCYQNAQVRQTNDPGKG